MKTCRFLLVLLWAGLACATDYQTNRVSMPGVVLIPTSIDGQGHVSGWAAPAKGTLLMDRQRFDWSPTDGLVVYLPPRKVSYDLSPAWLSKEAQILRTADSERFPMGTNLVGSVVYAVGGGPGFEVLTPIIRITQVQVVTIVSVAVPESVTVPVSVEASEDLSRWVAVGTNRPAGGVVTVSVTNSAVAGKRFYRARIADQR